MMMMTMTTMGLVSKTQMLKLMLMLQTVALLSAKPVTEKLDLQPVYEEQLTVWPTDIDDIVEAVVGVPIPLPLPVVDDPIVVMPVMDDEYDSVESLEDEIAAAAAQPAPVGTPAETVQVLENYHKTYANGTAEYKLTLSTGMVNYQRISYKKVNGEKRAIQDGYYTVPADTNPPSYQTIYYHADENGYNVYKTLKSPRNPAYDFYLQRE